MEEKPATPPPVKHHSSGGSSSPILTSHYCGDGICTESETCNSCSEDCGICPVESEEKEEVLEEKEVQPVVEEENDAVGVGQATGLFSNLKSGKILALAVGLLALIGLLVATSFSKAKSTKKYGQEWGKYFKERIL